MDVYVVLFKDGDCYGASQPMNEEECDGTIDIAHKFGYDCCAIPLNRLFELGHYDIDVYKA